VVIQEGKIVIIKKSQSVVKFQNKKKVIIITGLAKGEITKRNMIKVILKEFFNGFILAIILSIAAYSRVFIFQIFSTTSINFLEEFTIALSTFCIVMISSK
jgi:Mg/Co/Ni transporter MgtE